MFAFLRFGVSDVEADNLMQEDRLGGLEAKMGEVLDALGYLHALPHTFLKGHLTDIKRKNDSRREQQPAVNSAPPAFLNDSVTHSISNPPTPLPTWDRVLSIAELYLLYCESQPLPLFHRATFLSTLGDRDPEIIYVILALSIRFSERSHGNADELMDTINSYTEVARSLVTKRVWEGPVELSTLQSLCLLSLVDFTSRFRVDICAALQTRLTWPSRWKHTSVNYTWKLGYEPSSMCQFRLRVPYCTDSSGSRRT